MAQITYADKSFVNQNANVPAINKVQDTDLNEIKSVVNGLVSDTYSTDTEQSYSCNYMNGTILYSNTTGTVGNISLDDNISNYKTIEIFVRNNNNNFLYPGQRFYTNNSSSVSLQLNLCSNGSGAADIKGLRCLISNSSLTMSYFYKAVIVSGQTPYGGTGTNSELYIYRIVGYKY